MKLLKAILKWCCIAMVIGILCSVADGIIFILAAIFVWKVFIKGNSPKETLKGGIGFADRQVSKMKE